MAALAGSSLVSSHHHFASSRPTLDARDGSVSLDSSRGDSPRLHDDCTSTDTVLSVGNEAPLAVPLSFKNIESHLNAISQITNSTLDPASSSRSSSPSRSAPGSPPGHHALERRRRRSCPDSPNSASEFYFDRQKLHHHHQANENDTPANGSLKFSIDNILKADFGRRITDPIHIRKCKAPKSKATAAAEEVAEEVGKACPVDLSKGEQAATEGSKDSQPMLWPAWVYCTRYSDRPSSGRSPRTRRIKKPGAAKPGPPTAEEKRPRTAFSGAQLARLKHEFAENRYLTERRRQQLSGELGLNEAQIKIWFQNKRAKIKKASGQKNPLALQLMAQGLYNHSTIPLSKEEEELQELHSSKANSPS